MRVIGTAGHVDHGKSTLIQALTGIHPDRLKEEREREMTIDLGFAWLTLPNGEEIGIVDVPGHRDFIENMLSGVGGIDAALFVIAADEGVMPQTKEHLAILDLLQIQGGVVALTKIDLLDDGDWVDLVEEDIREVLHGTVLESAPIVRISSKTGEGLPGLLEALVSILDNRPLRPNLGRPRLPVDRVFTIAGFGTVVTGTLSDGILSIGDELEILPNGIRGRVRGLQTHKKKESTAMPGSRTAINISGVPVDHIQRGQVVTHPGDYQPTRRLDVQFRLLGNVSQPLKHNTETKLFIGATEVIARVRLLGVDELEPGSQGWLQLEVADPVVAIRGDRYILRRPSPGETLGGGMVVDPHPQRRYRRFSDEVLARLASLARGSATDILDQALNSLGAASWRDVVQKTSLESTELASAQAELLGDNRLIVLVGEIDPIKGIRGDALVTTQAYLQRLVGELCLKLDAFHSENPLRKGMPREELKSRMRISSRLYNALIERLVAEKQIIDLGPSVARPGHQIQFNPEQEVAVVKIMSAFTAAPFSPPSVKDTLESVGEPVYQAMLELGYLVQVSPEVVFSQDGYQRLLSGVQQLIRDHGPVTAAVVRDAFNTSRKYSLALLEHMDTIGITIRIGDERRLRSSAP